MTTLRVIMWDQLSLTIPSLRDADKQHDVILFCETHEACTRVKHHKKKLVFLLSAMRHFAEQLRSTGYRVCYVELTDLVN